ncbi:MAG: MBL fold metallo-hydrolase [Deltaproteobacteria bacterium]|nr:MBL fold metallo-hydrolase [Deltaproteobacteria bacterium]
MKIRILGCGTSTGVPVIGCRCEVCSSDEPRNRRTRTSALIQSGGKNGKNILIDTSTDLRVQSLKNDIERIDAVLFTHPHADHVHGIDDLRVFNLIQKEIIPCYGDRLTVERIKKAFDYIFTDSEYDGWKPSLSLSAIEEPFELFGLKVTPVGIYHGTAVITGWRINDAAYLTDCSSVPPESLERLRGVNVLIVGALRRRPHPSHFSIDQAVELSRKLSPERTVLTHLSHNVDYVKDGDTLPSAVELAYDGMEIDA